MEPLSVAPAARIDCEAGSSLLDLIVAMSLVSVILIVASSTFGQRTPSVHPSALALEAAITEARSIATMQQADETDAGLPTGATVSVELGAQSRTSIITVYRSRPIPNPNRPVYAAVAITTKLPVDTGFPRQTVPAVFTVTQIGNGIQAGAFSILISGAGLTTIEPSAYVPGIIFAPPDPGCADAGTTIAASSGDVAEVHPFYCRNASFDASAKV